MKLTDLDPQWIFDPVTGTRVGFLFRSPVKPEQYQSCFENPPAVWLQMEYFDAVVGEDAIVQPCNPEAHWTIAGDSFETLSVTPSLDGAKGGLWHGHITDGRIVGGI